jgi:hypothetical protein
MCPARSTEAATPGCARSGVGLGVVAGSPILIGAGARSDAMADIRISIKRFPLKKCFSLFLEKTKIRDELNAGWIYLLSTREQPNYLKIGMTTRTVEERVREINSATGVLIPFGVRRCWRVMEPSRSEKLVHSALKQYRIRDDREFFSVPLATQSAHQRDYPC